jgi:hypothetical protein
MTVFPTKMIKSERVLGPSTSPEQMSGNADPDKQRAGIPVPGPDETVFYTPKPQEYTGMPGQPSGTIPADCDESERLLTR